MVITRVDHVAIKTSASAGSSIYISHYPCNWRINIHFHPDHVTSSLPAWHSALRNRGLYVRAFNDTITNVIRQLDSWKLFVYLRLRFTPWIRDETPARFACQPLFLPRSPATSFGLRPQIVVHPLISPHILINSQHTKTQIGFRFVSKNKCYKKMLN